MTLRNPVLKVFGTVIHCKTVYFYLRNDQVGKNVIHSTPGGIQFSVKWTGYFSYEPFCVVGGSMDAPDSGEGDSQQYGEDVYYSVEKDTFPQEMASRPPVPVPRPESSSPQPDNELYISKGELGTAIFTSHL